MNTKITSSSHVRFMKMLLIDEPKRSRLVFALFKFQNRGGYAGDIYQYKAYPSKWRLMFNYLDAWADGHTTESCWKGSIDISLLALWNPVNWFKGSKHYLYFKVRTVILSFITPNKLKEIPYIYIRRRNEWNTTANDQVIARMKLLPIWFE